MIGTAKRSDSRVTEGCLHYLTDNENTFLLGTGNFNAFSELFLFQIPTAVNPRPDMVFHCFATFGRTGGGGGATPLGVSKRSVAELSGKYQQLYLAEYSRLVVLFLVLGQYLTELWKMKGQIFGNFMIFQLYESIAAKLSIIAAWDLHQRVPRSILHRIRCFDASRLNI